MNIVNVKRYTTIILISSIIIGGLVGWFTKPPQLIEIETIKEIEVEKEVEKIKYEIVDFNGEIFEVTAYCSCGICCGINADGITASGSKVKQGRTIAVDKSIIPLGSEVVIEGFDTVFTAEDTGNPKYMSGKRIDIYFEDHQKALEFGRKELKIWIIK